MPNDTQAVEEYLRAWANLPEVAVTILRNIFLFLAYIALFIGSIMIVWGAIEWATGYNELGGRKNIVRGVVLILLALAPMYVTST